jgi:hypothetical protein
LKLLEQGLKLLEQGLKHAGGERTKANSKGNWQHPTCRLSNFKFGGPAAVALRYGSPIPPSQKKYLVFLFGFLIYSDM